MPCHICGRAEPLNGSEIGRSPDMGCHDGVWMDVDEYTEGWERDTVYPPCRHNPAACSVCNGSGAHSVLDECSACEGSGWTGNKPQWPVAESDLEADTFSVSHPPASQGAPEHIEVARRIVDKIVANKKTYRDLYLLAGEDTKALEVILRAYAGASQGAVPEGWKLVPIKPTQEMCVAGAKEIGAAQEGVSGETCWEALRCWHGMLADAPPPPASVPAPTVDGEAAQITAEQIKAVLREHIKADATGYAPAIAGLLLVGFDEAAEAVAALIGSPAAPVDGEARLPAPLRVGASVFGKGVSLETVQGAIDRATGREPRGLPEIKPIPKDALVFRSVRPPEEEWLEHAMHQNCPACGGSGHVGDAEEVTAVIRRQALEEAARLIEERGKNNVGTIHPINLKDAAAIRSLASPKGEETAATSKTEG